jgi:hypothetical protein
MWLNVRLLCGESCDIGPLPWKDCFQWGSGYGQVASFCEYSDITQDHGLGQILLIEAHIMVEWQAVVSTIILHRAIDLDRFF